MESNKQPIIKQILLFFGLPFISGLLAIAVYEHLITPALPFLPKVPFILYSIFSTAFAVLFLLGLVGAIWKLFATGWKHLTRKELRIDLLEKIGRWPTSKWDLLPVIATTYFVATLLPMLAVLLVLPEGRLAGIVSQEEYANIFLVVFTPMLLVFSVMMVRLGFELYKDMKQRWVFGTRTERFTIATFMTFVVIAWVFMVVGDIAGWDDLL